ncbi:MAG: aldehyde dehydrogenase family protein, partial [Nitrososphaerota archaeon]
MFENEYTWGKAVANNATKEFDDKFEKAVEEIKKDLGKDYPVIINGKELFLDEKFEVRSPSDTRIILARFPSATKEDTTSAINSAKESFPKWSKGSYQQRAKIFKDCADEFSKQKFHLASIMSFENGKNRLEAMGDLDEAIDFMRFYAYQLEI